MSIPGQNLANGMPIFSRKFLDRIMNDNDLKLRVRHPIEQV